MPEEKSISMSEERTNCDRHCADCPEHQGMSGSCNHLQGPAKAPLNPRSRVKKVIGVMSGKGGVGKSLVTSLMAVAMQRKVGQVGILDADITGPSIPHMFGLQGQVVARQDGIVPAQSASGIKMISGNLILPHETDPVIWRGPMIAAAVKQFWTDVIWQDINYLFVDMPPGTGDVPLTVFQSLPLDGIVVVTTPQSLVSMIVAKAVKMAAMMDVKVLGLVENMSYFVAPDTGKRYNIFGSSHLEEVAQKYQTRVLAKLPIQPELAEACDQGTIENLTLKALDSLVAALEEL